MGLKICINGTNVHTGGSPWRSQSGLKRSPRVSKCHETLGAEHIRASHMVSQCHEILGAERIRALHEVSQSHETLGAERVRASQRVSKRGNHYQSCTLGLEAQEVAHRHGVGTPKADSTIRTLRKTP